MWLAILQAMKNKQLLTLKLFCQTEKNKQKTFYRFIILSSSYFLLLHKFKYFAQDVPQSDDFIF